jgi:hypothetical protein
VETQDEAKIAISTVCQIRRITTESSHSWVAPSGDFTVHHPIKTFRHLDLEHVKWTMGRLLWQSARRPATFGRFFRHPFIPRRRLCMTAGWHQRINQNTGFIKWCDELLLRVQWASRRKRHQPKKLLLGARCQSGYWSNSPIIISHVPRPGERQRRNKHCGD